MAATGVGRSIRSLISSALPTVDHFHRRSSSPRHLATSACRLGLFPHRMDKGDWKVAEWAVDQLNQKPEPAVSPLASSCRTCLASLREWFDLYPDNDSVLPKIYARTTVTHRLWLVPANSCQGPPQVAKTITHRATSPNASPAPVLSMAKSVAF